MSLDKETIKTFLLYFCVAGIIVLSINTYFLLGNQTKILDNQNTKAIPFATDTNQKVTHIEKMLVEDLSSEKVD